MEFVSFVVTGDETAPQRVKVQILNDEYPVDLAWVIQVNPRNAVGEQSQF
jgi:hypothetical protein